MPEYIDREAFLKHMRKTNRYFGVKFDVEEFPAADVEPVRHGRWVKVAWVPCDEPNGGYWIVRCTQCSIPHDKESRYCPNCGAKMGEAKP